MRGIAHVCIRQNIEARIDAITSGMARAGYRVEHGAPLPARRGDALVLWNRMHGHNDIADAYLRAGCPVFILENGYLGKSFAGSVWYALSLDHHNGAGRTYPQGPERWDALGVPLAPFRATGEEVVLLPQRGIGAPGVRMPSHWPVDAMSALKRAGFDRLRIRPHPGRNKGGVALLDDLAHARAVATWGSGAALRALQAGVPVFYGFKQWVGVRASRLLSDAGDGVLCDEQRRLAMFRDLAWGMWSVDELATGAPFARLLELGGYGANTGHG